ncbi:rod shape-determining protein MreD [Virgibacillus sp. 179-BFC.A HS]|uniref:Rod shape-determining protein MreD n=1 Tax=Tigheibacillus jepli TaxID=3035914 RepID=A0ABU5CGL8_9BACI|nr:rod shape-determining protein MreD [Virgibacillus sp. 179-BFC.A HS]MDY0405450.1 rod shape-determining protein MreD [Virgibacillus sp. 179-BFC.A HS]
MRRFYVPLILFLLMIMEGVALELLPDKLVGGSMMIVPHWVFIFLLLVAVFYDRRDSYISVWYAIIFGLLIDVVYTEILGVYMFTYAVTIYIIHGLSRFLQSNIFALVLFGILGTAIADGVINIIYVVVGLIPADWPWYFIYRLLPTIVANLIFLLIMYPIFSKRLERWSKEKSFNSDTFSL